MKQTIQLQKAQEKMRPGVITRDGFLGNDSRQLIEILTEDDAEVKRLGVTHQMIAEKMIELRDKGMQGLGEFINVEPHYEIRVDSVRGKLPCPFGDPGIYPKTNTTVKNLKLDTEITYTDLHIHMIYVHGFYEGKGSNFRLNPSDIVETIDVNSKEK